MHIQSRTLRTFKGRALGVTPVNSNFSPRTGKAICRVLCSYDLRTNPYPTVAKRGPEIERLMEMSDGDLIRLGLRRDAVVPYVLSDILAG